MTIQVITANAGSMAGFPDFFMARSPIVDRHQNVLAFELFFHPLGSPANVQADAHATAAILAHFAELDMLKVVGEFRGFIQIDTPLLMSDVLQHIPRSQCIFCLADTIAATGPVLQRLAELTGQGFLFALKDAGMDAEGLRELLPLTEVVKFDLRRRTREELVQRTSQAHFINKKLLAEHVDTLAQFEMCLALGFNYFQGDCFVRPPIIRAGELAPSQLAIIHLAALVSSDADSAEIEAQIKHDVSLGLNVLRLVNTAAMGTHRIDSLRQALMVLGRKQLANWLQIMLYAEAREITPGIKPLLLLATARGKLLELIAQRHRPGNRGIADAAFTVGIMSLMDSLFGLQMADILGKIAVAEEVSEALLARRGYYGDLLVLAEALEHGEDGPPLLPLLDKFHLASGDLFLLQAEACEWSNSVAHTMHA